MECSRDKTMMESTIHQFSDLNLSNAKSNKPSRLAPTRTHPRTTLKRIPKSIGKNTIKIDKSYLALLEDGRPRRDRKRNEGRRSKWWSNHEKALMHHPRGFAEHSDLVTKMVWYCKFMNQTEEDEGEVDSLLAHTCGAPGMDGNLSWDDPALHPDLWLAYLGNRDHESV
ncbi:uncharacterized protein NECHADRAFT_84104 [Fusarium vanettenii 77-13-4]|uniref:Uncharacterized protein n=1 Tax=Fusarium vanettenii (strain ATCC MYA-4622 / CBS 123669 / FGSC 9596 / NRRL 45880 / 77-13-4) TaxID=660122 RepID=C7YZQ0_FUSV7|nr:uncharacterized protein NECHADRAFT_84104 [Fusarium vanettenii 77-13-4]EEU42647.1 predicted protein [Fusarium vanettenii 77-13-4]